MNRNQTYINLVLNKNPSLIKYLDIEKLLKLTSLLSINNIIKESLINNGISIEQLSTVSINDLNFISRFNNIKIKN
tara:strand:+ start:574 stop:801 length:228 start_codon:yes stop_codon:yes gene_type:complete